MEKLDIIVLAGQSNAQGQGQGSVTTEYVPDSRILFMKDDSNPKFSHEGGVTKLVLKWPAVNTVDIADERIKNGQKIGCFALQFAEKYAQEYLEEGRKVLIVDANFGGTGFARPEWGVGNIMHERMISMVTEALSYGPDNRVVAVLWSQGEHDSFENADWDPEKRYVTHKKNLTETFKDFYARVDAKDAPIIACGFTDDYYATTKVACDAVLNAIRECIADVGGAFVDTAGLMSNSGATGSKDIYHFCRESLHILGGKLFDAYKTVRNNG